MTDIEAGLSPTARLARGQRKDLVMGQARLHVVFGTGQVGSALAAHLASLGMAVRAVSRHRPATLAGGIDWRAADVTDPEAAADVAKGASAVCQCVNAPYTQWPERFPPLQRGVLAAAEAGRVRLAIGRASDFFGPGVTQGSVASPAAR